jgi:hypothetical protein
VFNREEEISIAISAIMTVILGDLLSNVFSQWMKSFRNYVDTNDDHVK